MKDKVAGEGLFWREKIYGGNPCTASLQHLTVHGLNVRFGLLAKGHGKESVYIGGYFSERMVSGFYREIVTRWQCGDFFTREELEAVIGKEIEAILKEIEEYCNGRGIEGKVSFRGILLMEDAFVAFEKGEGKFYFQEIQGSGCKLYPVYLPPFQMRKSFGMSSGLLYEEGVFFCMEEGVEVKENETVRELWERSKSECIYLLNPGSMR